MKSVLLAAAFAVIASSAALAQPGPGDYPPCTHPGQDHCREVGRMGGDHERMHHEGRHHHHHHGRHHHVRHHRHHH